MQNNTNNNVKIIVSRYNENLEWINDYPFNQFKYIVYNKGIDTSFCKNNVLEIINLENVGRNDHTYLYHIVNNYDNLSNIIIFFPGSINMSCKKEKAKILLEAIIKSDYKNAFFLGSHQDDIFETFKNFELDEWQASDISNSSLNPERKLQLCKLRPFGRWYKYFFGNIKAKWNTYLGIFSIDKRDVLQHKKIKYELLMNTLINSSNPEAGHYIERSWGAIFYPMIYTKKISY